MDTTEINQNQLPDEAVTAEMEAIQNTDKEEKCQWQVVKSILGKDEFALNTEGVHQVDISESRIKSQMLICAPLRIVADSRDTNGENWGRVLEFHDKDGKLQRYHMKMQDLRRDGDDVIDALLSRGLPIAPGKKARNKLVEYIQNGQPANNAKALSSDRTGWHGNRFILPHDVLGSGQDTIIYHGRQPEPEAFGQMGSLDDWRTHVAALSAGNSRLVLGISTVFAASLLQLTGEESGGVHLVGNSSTGKSTALYVAASVMGLPKPYIQSWRVTTNGLEGIAKFHNDSCLILDELSQVSPKEAGEISYMLANGSGKLRANIKGEARQKASWKLLFLSSGEITLADHMLEGGKKAKAGQEIRLVDIQADAGKGMGLFDTLHDSADGAAFSNLLKSNSSRYYGTAFRAYMLALIENAESLAVRLRELRQEIHQQLVQSDASGQVERVAARFTLIAAAGELATEYGITGWEKYEATKAAVNCFKSWLELRGGTGQQETRTLLSQVRGFFEKYGDAKFVRIHRESHGRLVISDEKQRVYDRVGFSYEDEHERRAFVVLPQAMREICAGFNFRAALKMLIEAKVIIPAKDGKSQVTVRLPDMGPTKVYNISGSIWS